MALIWQRYNQLLIDRPLITKGLTGGSLFAIGDFMAQYLDGTLHSQSGYNPKRTAIGFCWSACIFTPHGHAWYSKILPKVFPTSKFKDSLAKVIIDQTLFATYINTLYLSYSTLAHGGTIDDAQNKVKKDLWTVLKANYYLWPAVQFATFSFVPLQLQLPVMNIAVMFWSCYLATIGNRERVAASQIEAPFALNPALSVPSTIIPSPTPQFTQSVSILASIYDNHGGRIDLGAIPSPPNNEDNQHYYRPFTNNSHSTPSENNTTTDDAYQRYLQPRSQTQPHVVPPTFSTSPSTITWLKNLEYKLKMMLPETLVQYSQTESTQARIQRLYEQSPSKSLQQENTTLPNPQPAPILQQTQSTTSSESTPKTNQDFFTQLATSIDLSKCINVPLYGLYKSISFVTNTYDSYYDKQKLREQYENDMLRASVIILDALEGTFNDETITILDSLEYTKFLELDQIIFLNEAKNKYLEEKAQKQALLAKEEQRKLEQNLILSQLSTIALDNLDDDEKRLEMYQKYPFLLTNLNTNPFNPSTNSKFPPPTPEPSSQFGSKLKQDKTRQIDPDYVEYAGGDGTENSLEPTNTPFKIANPNKLSPTLLSTMDDDELLTILFDNDVPKNKATIFTPFLSNTTSGTIAHKKTKYASQPQFLTPEEISQINNDFVHHDLFSTSISNENATNYNTHFSKNHDHDEYDERGNPISPAVKFGFKLQDRENDDIVKSFFEPYNFENEQNLPDGTIMISLDNDNMAVIRNNTKNYNKLWVTDRGLDEIPLYNDDGDDEISFNDEDEADMLELYIDFNKDIQLAKKIKAQRKNNDAQATQEKVRQEMDENNINQYVNAGLLQSKVYGQTTKSKHRGYQDEDGFIFDIEFFDDVDDNNDFTLHAHQPMSSKRTKSKEKKQLQQLQQKEEKELIQTSVQFSTAYADTSRKGQNTHGFDFDGIFSRHEKDDQLEESSRDTNSLQRDILHERSINKHLFKP